MCNAGIMNQAAELSKDGYEIQFATNHMGHALLIKLLLPTLLKTVDSQQPGRQGDVRIVILSSAALATTPKTGVEFETVKTAQNHFSSMNGGWIRYGQSKLANALYAAELAKVRVILCTYKSLLWLILFLQTNEFPAFTNPFTFPASAFRKSHAFLSIQVWSAPTSFERLPLLLGL